MTEQMPEFETQIEELQKKIRASQRLNIAAEAYYGVDPDKTVSNLFR